MQGTYLSIRQQHQPVEHVEDLGAWLVDGEDDGSVRVRQLAQLAEEFEGGGCIQPCGCVCMCVCVCAMSYCKDHINSDIHSIEDPHKDTIGLPGNLRLMDLW